MFTHQSIKFFLENKAKTLFYLILIILPFVVTSYTNEAYEFPKVTLLYLLGGVFSLGYLYRLLRSDEKIIRRELWFVFAYLGLFIVSTAFSVNVYTSVFGYFSRFNGGLATTIIFICLFLYVYRDFSSSNFNKILIFSTLPVSIVSLTQAFDPAITRVFSTFGQPNWLAMYLAMMLLLQAKMFLESNDLKEKVFYGFNFAILYLSFWKTFSLSGYLGFAVGVVVFLILNLSLIKKQIKSSWVLLAIILIISLSNFNYFSGRFLDAINSAKNIISQSVTVFADKDGYVYSDTGFIRFGIWEGAVKIVASNPRYLLIGTGPETFPYIFQQFRPASLNYSSEWDYILNKPHNYYLEILSEQGILSLVLYIYFIYLVVKRKNKTYTPVLASYFISNIFGWSSLYNEMLFWILFALILKTREQKI